MRERVVVVGSGAAGLVAALAAAEAGRAVTVLERADRFGGSTAWSDGLAWLPGHHLMDEPEEPDLVLDEVSVGAGGDWDEVGVATVVAEAPRAAVWTEHHTFVRWVTLPDRDHHQGPAGDRRGRAVEPRPVVVPAEIGALIGGGTEVDRGAATASVTGGRALVGALVMRLRELGVELRPSMRVDRLRREGDHVVGVVCGAQHFRARVVLATGGFERERALVQTFLGGPVAPTGAPGLTGDGLRMAMAIGAQLGNMSEAWWAPTMAVPGAADDDAPIHRPLVDELARPGALLIDGSGRRFLDESQPSDELGRRLSAVGRCWLVIDERCRARYQLGPLAPRSAAPDWLARADDLEGLADRIGVPGGVLRSTVQRFNDHATRGQDPDFGRVGADGNRVIGDPSGDDRGLAPLAEPPFSAIEVHRGCLATKGGLRTDDHGRVRDAWGETIRGLYAAGAVAASPLGSANPGPGAPIGTALVAGLRAGEAAASDDG